MRVIIFLISKQSSLVLKSPFLQFYRISIGLTSGLQFIFHVKIYEQPVEAWKCMEESAQEKYDERKNVAVCRVSQLVFRGTLNFLQRFLDFSDIEFLYVKELQIKTENFCVKNLQSE